MLYSIVGLLLGFICKEVIIGLIPIGVHFIISNIILSLVLIKKDKLKAPVYIKVIYYFVIENVKSLLSTSKGWFKDEIISAIKKICQNIGNV